MGMVTGMGKNAFSPGEVQWKEGKKETGRMNCSEVGCYLSKGGENELAPGQVKLLKMGRMNSHLDGCYHKKVPVGGGGGGELSPGQKQLQERG